MCRHTAEKLITSIMELHFHYMMLIIEFVKGRKCLTPVFRFWEPANNIWLNPKTKLEKVLTLRNLLRVQDTVNLTSTTEVWCGKQTQEKDWERNAKWRKYSDCQYICKFNCLHLMLFVNKAVYIILDHVSGFH